MQAQTKRGRCTLIEANFETPTSDGQWLLDVWGIDIREHGAVLALIYEGGERDEVELYAKDDYREKPIACFEERDGVMVRI